MVRHSKCYRLRITCIFIYCFISLLACHQNGAKNDNSTIQTTATLEFLTKEMDVLDKNSLVIFDINKVILTKKDPAERGFEKERKNALSAPSLHVKNSILYNTLDETTRDYLWSIYARSVALTLVDKKAPQIIRALQTKFIKVMGLTSFPVGKCGTIDSLVDWQTRNVLTLGIDFSLAAPSAAIIHFKQFPCRGDTPIYKKGILFTGLCCSKGDALMAFLEEVKWMPHQIIMIDDKLENLISVQKKCQLLNIPFRGYEYTAYKKLPAKFDKNTVEQQMQYLLKHQKWINSNAIHY